MDKVSFSWNLLYKCNYRCPYCWFEGKWLEMEKTTRYLPVKELMNYWENVHKRYGSAVIDILGGEPFLYPNFIDLVKELSEAHFLNITTNLSCNINEFVEKIDSSKVGIGITFHPLFADFNSFVNKALLLKENGFVDKVTYLAYPPQIKMMKSYKDKFLKEGFSLSVMSFWGKYKGVSYPAGYTEEEKTLIEPDLGNRAGEKFQITPKEVKGMLCNAGHTYAVIKSDGATFRCGGVNSSDTDLVMANFFDSNFRLLKGPLPCSSEHCPCNEWAFLLTEKNSGENAIKKVSRESIAPHRVFFSWYLNNECNYKCSFCKPEDIKTRFIGVDKWVDIWDKIYDDYGGCHIHISGGEPFIYPGFIELIARLSEKHTLEFSTNLSMEIEPFMEAVKPERARLGGSFHPEFSNFEEFFDKIVKLKANGYDVWANYVAYPLHLEDMHRYKKSIEDRGIQFSIQPFNGTFEGREYPLGYTEQEKSIMTFGEVNKVNKDTIDWRTDEKKSSIKGKLCRMGQMYARVYPNGEVCRCCGNGASKLGNLIDGTFRLLDDAMPCECDNCPCWKCMHVGKEEYWKNHWVLPKRLNT